MSFRIEEERLNLLDELLWQNKVAGNLPRDTSRSMLLRLIVERLIYDLSNSLDDVETQNPNIPAVWPAALDCKNTDGLHEYW